MKCYYCDKHIRGHEPQKKLMAHTRLCHPEKLRVMSPTHPKTQKELREWKKYHTATITYQCDNCEGCCFWDSIYGLPFPGMDFCSQGHKPLWKLVTIADRRTNIPLAAKEDQL